MPRRSARRALLAGLASCALLAHLAPGRANPGPTLVQQVARNSALPAAPTLALEAFTRHPRIGEAVLSPDGVWLAFVETVEHDTSLNLLNIASGRRRQLLASVRPASLHWSRDSATLFLADRDGVSTLSIKDGASAKIAAFDAHLQQRFLRVDQHRPHAVLIEQFDPDTQRYRQSRLDADGRQELLYTGKRKVLDALQSGSGELNVVLVYDAQFQRVVLRRDGAQWSEVAHCARQDACTLVGASADGRRITLISSAAGDRAGLVERDLTTGRARQIHGDPAGLAELRSVVMAPASGLAQFATYQLPTRHQVGLTVASRRAAIDIDRQFPNQDIDIGLADDAQSMLITESGARTSAQRYWLYNSAQRTFRQLLKAEHALGAPLPEAQLASKIALDYRASDGAIVHAYLSLPPGKVAAHLPLLTIVHGGPWMHADAAYAPLVQWIVNHGVAVFQPNYRSSVGYGDAYAQAAHGQFGNGPAQTDVIDGVQWLLAHGVGDKRRLAIIGESFGGYTTLMALTHTPQLFQFGIASSPPPDFARTLRTLSDGDDGDAFPRSLFIKDMGVRVDDASVMNAIAAAAPAALPQRVTRPLLIMAGARDDLVPIAAISDYVARLQQLDRPVSLLVDPEEGHNWHSPLAGQAYAWLLETMLHRYLGTATPQAPGAAVESYLRAYMKADAAHLLRSR